MGALEGVKVVLIESDPPGSKLASVVLRQAGADVIPAYDAEQALRLVDAVRPRVVVVDLELPVVSGLVLVRHISQLSWAASTVIVGISTGNGRQLEQDARAYGCHGFLAKPIDSRLVEIITKCLGGTT